MPKHKGKGQFMADLFGYDKIKTTIERIRQFEPPEGYYLAFSGGKDSVVLKALVDLSGVKYDAHMSITTVDPPELLRFIKQYHSDVIFDKPKSNMWNLIIYNKFPPTRIMRYCCEQLKECHGHGRLLLTGIRTEESNQRKKRQLVEQCRNDPRKRYVHPIIDWTEQEIWQFIKDYKLPYCSLYDEGFKRIGCVMCPQASRSKRLFDCQRFPNFYRAYLRTFNKLIELYPERYTTFKSGQDIMDWWLSDIKALDNTEGLFT